MIQSGATTVIVNDGGPGDLDGTVNNQILIQSGAGSPVIPGFNVQSESALTTTPGLPTGAYLQTGYIISAIGSGGGTITITTSATGFDQPPASANLLTLTSVLNGNGTGNGTIIGQAWADPTNTLFGMGADTSGPQGPFAVGAAGGYGNQQTATFDRANGPYALTSQFSLTLDPGAATTGSFQITVPVPPQPGITTSQQPAIASVGSSIADKATVTGGNNPTGTVTFNLYNNPNATGTPLFTDTETLVNGMATSAGFTATTAGTDYWVATYNGDSNNSTVTSGAALEPVVITPATPAINTQQQPATATVGSSITDKATVTGGDNPTGTVTFKLYSNPNGTGTPLFTDTEVLVNGVATSASYTTAATGTDYWVATYNGDSNNSSVTSGTALEPVTISPATPAINTQQQPATATVGSSIADKATVTGGDNPTGTVTFKLYSNPNGTGTPLFTDTEMLVNGAATSASYTTAATGTDYWVATYNGDSNNNPVTSGTALEPVSITPNAPTITTTPGCTVTIGCCGSKLTDTATLSGVSTPTGTITFYLFAPGVTPNAHNSNNVYSDVVTVNGDGTFSTATGTNQGGYAPTVPGTYEWVAVYSGDANNASATSTFGSEPESVIAATPTLTTCPGGTVVLGSCGVLTDTATLRGGNNPTGTLTFKLYAPNGTTVVDTESVTVAGDGTYRSPNGYVPTATGMYQWVVSYSGDIENRPITGKLGSEPECVVAATTKGCTVPGWGIFVASGPKMTHSATLSDGDNASQGDHVHIVSSKWGERGPRRTTLKGNGAYDTPKGFVSATAGTYRKVVASNTVFGSNARSVIAALDVLAALKSENRLQSNDGRQR
jgi:hypothetical protein